jgi:hypothetical protein
MTLSALSSTPARLPRARYVRSGAFRQPLVGPLAPLHRRGVCVNAIKHLAYHDLDGPLAGSCSRLMGLEEGNGVGCFAHGACYELVGVTSNLGGVRFGEDPPDSQ